MSIEVHWQDGITEVVLNHPPVNALDSRGWFELADTLRRLGRDESVRVVLLAAEGRGFLAGVDIKELQRDGRLITQVNRGCYEAFAAIYDCEVPVIAAVHGFCLGGGIGIAGAAATGRGAPPPSPPPRRPPPPASRPPRGARPAPPRT